MLHSRAGSALAVALTTGAACAQGSGTSLDEILAPFETVAWAEESGSESTFALANDPDLDALALIQTTSVDGDPGFWDVWRHRRDVDGLGLITFGATLGALVPVLATGDEELIRDVGDYTQIIPSVVGGTATLFEPTWEGTRQFAYSGLTTLATTHLLKSAVDRWRPDGTDADSFPSGHTSFSFQGAGFIGERYGSRFGISAYAMALYTAYSRVQGQKHYADDTLTGASLAVFANWLFVSPYDPGEPDGGVDVQAMVMPDGGLGLGLSTRIRPRAVRDYGYVLEQDEPSALRWRYELEVGTAWSRSNIVRSPASTGTELDFATFETNSNPDIYALGMMTLTVHDRWEFSLALSPYELRDQTTFDQPVSFGGRTFGANEPTITQFLAYDWYGSARYVFSTLDPWIVKLGAAVVISDTEVRMLNSTTEASVREVTGVPFVTGALGYRLSDEFALVGDADAGLGPFYSATARILWTVADDWDVGLGWRGVWRTIDTTDLFNELRQNRAFLSLAYSF